MKVYIDIEGVLIGPNGHPAKGVDDFLNYVTDMYECFWLSSYCRQEGDNPIAYLVSKGFSEDAVLAAAKVKPAYWSARKTEVINMKEDFVWFEDSPSASDLVALEKNRVRSRLYLLKLANDPYGLCEALEWLMSLEDDAEQV